MSLIKIAIVEDSRTTREGMQRIINLSSEYRCVCTCETAEEALTALPRFQPDITLMDIQLPGMSGIECVSQIKEQLPEMQIIMLTVYEDPDRIFEALRAGASGYLLKRLQPDDVLNAIREVQQGGVPMSAAVARKVCAYFQNQKTVRKEIDNLSDRERTILELIVQGFSNKEIASRLAMSIETVRWHLRRIYKKLHVHSRTDAVLKFRPLA